MRFSDRFCVLCLVLILFAGLSFSAEPSKVVKDQDGDVLAIGPVKSLAKTTWAYVDKFGQQTKKLRSESTYRFSEAGKFQSIKVVTYDDTGNMRGAICDVYDDAGNLVDRNSYGRGNVLLESRHYERTPDGKTVREVGLDGKGSRKIYSDTVVMAPDVEETTRYDKGAMIDKTIRRTFLGEEVKTIYKPSGDLVVKISRKFDIRSWLIQSEFHDAKGLVFDTVYERDDKGLTVKEIINHPGRPKEERSYVRTEVDPRGNPTAVRIVKQVPGSPPENIMEFTSTIEYY